MHENVIFYTFPTPFRVIIKGNLLKISLIPEYKDSRSGYQRSGNSFAKIIIFFRLCNDLSYKERFEDLFPIFF